MNFKVQIAGMYGNNLRVLIYKAFIVTWLCSVLICADPPTFWWNVIAVSTISCNPAMPIPTATPYKTK